MRILKAGILYCALVFGSGFVLGTVRVLLVVPRFGARLAELMEMPLMVLISFAGARWVVRRRPHLFTRPERMAIGFIALVLLILAEFTFVLWVRGLTISQYLANRDPVAGSVYVVALGLFALMPLAVSRR